MPRSSQMLNKKVRRRLAKVETKVLQEWSPIISSSLPIVCSSEKSFIAEKNSQKTLK